MNPRDRLKHPPPPGSRLSSEKEGQRILRKIRKNADEFILWYEVQKFEAEYEKRHKGETTG